MDKTGVALIGCGEIAHLHARALERIGQARIVAALDRLPERAHAIADLYGATAYADLEPLLEDPRVEAVYVLTRHDSHPGLIRRCLSAGKHVFSEKPLALTVDEALPLVDAVQASGRYLMVGFNHRWNPAVRWLRNRLQEAGTPVRCVQITLATSPFLQSWAGMEGEGGGVLPCLGSHALDLACYLLSDAPARLSVLTSRQRLPEPFLADTAGVVLQSRSGAIATLCFHDHAAPSYPNYARPGSSPLVRAEVFADGFTGVIEDSHSIRLYDKELRTIRLDDLGPLDTLGIYPEDQHFILCLQSGLRPEPDERDGVRAVRLAAAAAVSAETGCTVEISPEA